MATRPAVCSYPWMAGLVRLGLADFAAALGYPEDLYQPLLEDAGNLMGKPLDFREAASVTRRGWPDGSDNFAELVRVLTLDVDDAFALALAGEAETSYALNILLSELQQPGESARPTVHFCSALLDHLFRGTVLTSENIHAHPLLKHKVLSLNGQGPTPLCDVAVNPYLWAMLRGVDVEWPGCRFIDTPRALLVPEETRSHMSQLRQRLADGDCGLAIRGMPGSGREQAAAYLSSRMGRRALAVPVDVWLAEPAIEVACRVAGWLPVLSPSLGPGERWTMRSPGIDLPFVVLLSRDGSIAGVTCVELELGLPGESQREALWLDTLADAELSRKLAAGILIGAPSILSTARAAALLAEREGKAVQREHVLRARWRSGGDRLRLLAQPVEKHVTEDSLVLPDEVKTGIADMAARASRRDSLSSRLGVTLKAAPACGLRVLFVGESGTGKTMAASLVANTMFAPLYRVDSAAVMNKYIGESEKNVAALLDDAAAHDVVLLFDEAEATFARRGEGKGRDAGQHFSDMLSNFLLTRIENHPGVVILTTNNRERIDPAFVRRLDYIVEFPMPDFESRRELWQKHLGRRSPGDDVCISLASYCDLPGGNIRNAVLNAATRHADSRAAIPLATLVQCVRDEYHKIGRTSPPQLKTLGAAS